MRNKLIDLLSSTAAALAKKALKDFLWLGKLGVREEDFIN